MKTLLHLSFVAMLGLTSFTAIDAMEPEDKYITQVINRHGADHENDQVVLVTYPNPLGLAHMTGIVRGKQIPAKAYPLTIFGFWPQEAAYKLTHGGFLVEPKEVLLVAVGKHAETFTEFPDHHNLLIIEKDGSMRLEKAKE